MWAETEYDRTNHLATEELVVEPRNKLTKQFIRQVFVHIILKVTFVLNLYLFIAMQFILFTAMWFSGSHSLLWFSLYSIPHISWPILLLLFVNQSLNVILTFLVLFVSFFFFYKYITRATHNQLLFFYFLPGTASFLRRQVFLVLSKVGSL